MAQFQDLPDEVLSRILAFTSLLDATRAKLVCKHLKRVCDGQLSQDISEMHVCASAGSTCRDLHDAIKDAARRACQGMQGGVDVAVLFIAGYAAQRRLDASHNDLRQAGPAALLQKYVPAGVPVLGCTSDGIMSVGPNSEVLEIDPEDRRRRHAFGVAVMLMRAPGYELRPFVDSHGLLNESGITPADSFRRWVHASVHTPNSTTVTDEGDMTATGNTTSGIHQSDALSGDGQAADTSDENQDMEVAMDLQAKMVWLLSTQAYMAALQQMVMLEGVPGAVFWKQDLMSWIPKSYQNDVVVAGGIAAGPLPQLFFAPGDGPGGAAHPAWKVAALKKAQFVGLAVCSKNSHGQTSQNTATGEAHSAWMKCSESDVCAAAGAFLGLGPYYPAGDGYSSVYSDIEVSVMHEGGSPHIHLACPGTHRSGRGSAFWLSLHTFIESMDRGPYSHLAIWRHDGPPGSEAHLTQDIICSDHCIMLSLEERLRSLGLYECSLDLEPCTQDIEDRIKRISRDGSSKVRVQLVAANGLGCNRQLPHLLSVLDRCCSRPTAGTTINKQQLYMDVLDHLSKNAQAHGARCGPCATAVFSCNGRGSALYVDQDAPTNAKKQTAGRAHETPTQLLSEACLLDQAFKQRVPFIGGFFGGEIGPVFPETSPVPWASIAVNQGALRNLKRSKTSSDDQQQILEVEPQAPETQVGNANSTIPGHVDAGIEQLQVDCNTSRDGNNTTGSDDDNDTGNSDLPEGVLPSHVHGGDNTGHGDADNKERLPTSYAIRNYSHISCEPWYQDMDDSASSSDHDDDDDDHDDNERRHSDGSGKKDVDGLSKGARKRVGLRIGQTVFPHCTSVLQGYTSMYAMLS